MKREKSNTLTSSFHVETHWVEVPSTWIFCFPTIKVEKREVHTRDGKKFYDIKTQEELKCVDEKYKNK